MIISIFTHFTVHEGTLSALAVSDAAGTVIGFYRSLKPNRLKTPFPCKFHWSMTQMFETTPNTQQCVRMIIEASFEYFFVMTDSISDSHQYIYVHQTRSTLCLHRLELNFCGIPKFSVTLLCTTSNSFLHIIFWLVSLEREKNNL